MRRRLIRRAPAVALALTAPLILSSAGRGSDPAVSDDAQGAEAAVCRAVPASNAPRDLEQQVDRLAASGQIAGSPNVVVLNTQGYNYATPADPQLERLRLEALQLEAELRRRGANDG